MKKIVLLLIINSLIITARGQTRFYMRASNPVGVQQSGDPRSLAVIAPPHSDWTVVTGFEKILLGYYYSANSNAAATSAPTGGAAPRKILITQFVSPELMAQTINGTLTAQTRWRSASGLTVGQGFIYLRLINNDGTLAREIGTLNTVQNIPAPTSTNRTYTTLDLSNIAITGGQRLLLEVGWFMTSGTNGTLTAIYQSQNDRSTADLPVDDATTSALNPWFEFSQTLRLQTQNLFF